jgi:hypothetical protein
LMAVTVRKLDEHITFFRVGWESIWYVGHYLIYSTSPRWSMMSVETVGGMRIGRGNWSTRRKPVPVSLCPPQIPDDLHWDRTRAAAVGSRRLTAMAPPAHNVSIVADEFQPVRTVLASKPLKRMEYWEPAARQSVLVFILVQRFVNFCVMMRSIVDNNHRWRGKIGAH